MPPDDNHQLPLLSYLFKKANLISELPSNAKLGTLSLETRPDASSVIIAHSKAFFSVTTAVL
jgi:hypothetical protein